MRGSRDRSWSQAALALIPGGPAGTRDEVRPYLDGILEGTVKDEAEPWPLVSAVAALVRSAAGTRSPSAAAVLFLFHLYHQLAVERQGRVMEPILTTAARRDVARWLIEGRPLFGPRFVGSDRYAWLAGEEVTTLRPLLDEVLAKVRPAHRWPQKLAEQHREAVGFLEAVQAESLTLFMKVPGVLPGAAAAPARTSRARAAGPRARRPRG